MLVVLLLDYLSVCYKFIIRLTEKSPPEETTSHCLNCKNADKDTNSDAATQRNLFMTNVITTRKYMNILTMLT